MGPRSTHKSYGWHIHEGNGKHNGRKLIDAYGHVITKHIQTLSRTAISSLEREIHLRVLRNQFSHNKNLSFNATEHSPLGMQSLTFVLSIKKSFSNVTIKITSTQRWLFYIQFTYVVPLQLSNDIYRLPISKYHMSSFRDWFS